MLELRNVSKRFSGSLAVDSVSFCARAGEVTGYLGPNGSGKSTHDQDDRWPHRHDVRRDLHEWAPDSTRPDRLEAADGLRARGASPVRRPVGFRIPRHGRSIAGFANAGHGGSHRWPASAAGAARREARAYLRLLEGHAPEGAPGSRPASQPRTSPAGRTVFRARRGYRARLAQPDPGTGGAR